VTAASAREPLLRPDYVVPHTDADGLAAGAIALRARGEGAAAAVPQERSIRLAHSLARTRSRAAFCLQIEIRHPSS
jgi:oligoribonuclease NrnB/cAMP/cGMP phosphodiesterase (DHH superfamily)